jgi:co-chaperonin GroES (HSP10)
MTCKVGDDVLVPSRLLSGKNGNEITLDGNKYILVRESDIAMVSTKE